MDVDANVSEISLVNEGEVKSPDSNFLEENEARLRKKLLEKQQKKNDSRFHTTSVDEEEMFTIQPDFQETKKKEVVSKSEKERLKDHEEKEKQREKEKERSLRRPIEWKTKDDRSVISKSRDQIRFELSPHLHHRGSPSKRRWKDQKEKDDQRRFEKNFRNEPYRDHHYKYDETFKKSELNIKVDVFKDRLEKIEIDSTSKTWENKDKKITGSSVKNELEKEKISTVQIIKEETFKIEMSSKKMNRKIIKVEKSKLNEDNHKHSTKSKIKKKEIKKELKYKNMVVFSPPKAYNLNLNLSPELVKASLLSSPKKDYFKESTSPLLSHNDENSPLQNNKKDELSINFSGNLEKNDQNSDDSEGMCYDVSVSNSPNMSNLSQEQSVEKNNSNDEAKATRIKYSKFESSSESESDCDNDYNSETERMDEDLIVSNEENIRNLSEIKAKCFGDLTEEEKIQLSPETLSYMENAYQRKLISYLPIYYAGISGCRSVAEFENLNRIEEGTFGVVYRAIEKKTDEVVALKRLKMENEKEGFPITSLREINMLLKCGSHPNIVRLREIVVGSNIDKIYLVMEYVDHDMKSLMEIMSKKKKKFTIGQVKTLLQQLLSGVNYMHTEFVIHRDLKTSNLLLTRDGILKIGDFGLAREFGDPIKPYTQVVVTLWYRSPELLLGCKEYSTAIDMWSVGCIFSEFLQFKPIFPGRGEVDQLHKIFTEIGTPNEKIWPGFSELPGVKKCIFPELPHNQLKKRFGHALNTAAGLELLNRLLAPCPERRISAAKALESQWFKEDPAPVDPSFFPTFPSKSDTLSRNGAKIDQTIVVSKTKGPKPTADQLQLMQDLNVDAKHASHNGFELKFGIAKF